MASYENQDLYDFLRELKIIPQKKLDEVFEETKVTGALLDELLIQKDLISDEDVGKSIAELLNAPFVSLSSISFPETAKLMLPEEFARNHKVIVFEEKESSVKVATNNPKDKDVLVLVSKKTGKEVIPYFATIRDIEKSFNIYKKDLQKTFNKLLEEQMSKLGEGKPHEAPIIKIVDLLIEYAYANTASDIHIEPERNRSVVRFRIDGIMHEVLSFSLEIHKQVISRIKVLSKLQTDEHLSAQDGKMQANLAAEDLDIRVSIVPITHGENCVMRLLSSHYRQFGLSDLGMNKSDFDKVSDAIQKPFGMILSTGPTGSGKTTTMYAILKILNTRDRNIATIEDPVEYDIEGLNQIQVNPKTNLTFAEGLRSILRQDPNVIYVGEIRDDETADIAVNSAMTGHIVLSTLHTNDAATAIPRLIDMKIEPFLVASTINIIIAQRLVRKICLTCKVSYIEKTSEILKHFDKSMIKKIFGARQTLTLYKGKGCNVCHNTGYTGRVGIFEILEMSESIEDLVVKKTDAPVINKQAIGEGMTTMLEDGLEKVKGGETTLEEVLRVTKE
ncbi:MAG: Flp pilus assembly complex ATPase component TadA [Candidatus Levybacteria bacterium]|nr:Flp pilus assembly complex ATPase component TadA [Candidatus Levybacteria bacterium]